MPRLYAATYIRVTKVGRSRRGRIAERTQVVELLTGVVGVDVDAVPRELVDRVLDGPDAAGGGVLGDANIIAQAPPQDAAIVVVVVGPAGRHIKGLDHGAAALDVLGAHVQVVVAPPGDDEDVGLLLGHGQRAADVVCVVHAADDCRRGP